jgi:hypothetical protein
VQFLQSLFNDKNEIDRLACFKAMRNPALEAYQSWLAAQLLDSTRDVINEERYIPNDIANLVTLCNESTVSIHRLHVQAVDLTFFNSLTKGVITNPLNYLLSKCINQRCQGRKFSSVAMRKIKADKQLGEIVQEIVLCSLLGNYCVSAAASRPTSTVRDLLFMLLRRVQNNEISPWLLRMLKKCRSLVMFCLREHVVYLLEEQPGVLRQVYQLMQFEKYKSIVNEAMICLRDYMERMLSCNESSLYQDAIEENASERWTHEINFIMKPFDDAILNISYRRPKQTFRQFMLAVSNKVDEEEAKENYDSGEITSPIVRHVQTTEVAALKQLAEALVSQRFGVLEEMLKWLPLMHVSKEAIDFVMLLIREHRTGGTPLKELKGYFKQMLQHLPRLYQLIQITTEVIEHSRRIHTIGVLPSSQITAQIEACQRRFSMQPVDLLGGPGNVLRDLFFFFYCDVCFTVYSLLLDSKSVYKHDYDFGLRDAVMDYQSGELFCKRGRQNYRGCCDNQPLTRIPVLGRVLSVKDNIVQMCAHCGRLMIVRDQCTVTALGRDCCYCSQLTSTEKSKVIDLISYYNQDDRWCMFCGVQLQHASGVYVYPYRIYVCSQHASPYLNQHTANYIEESRYRQRTMTYEEKRAALEMFMCETIEHKLNTVRKNRATRDKKRRMVAATMALEQD